jgi:hypothetical protein
MARKFCFGQEKIRGETGESYSGGRCGLSRKLYVFSNCPRIIDFLVEELS